jgi:hypothetical protein
VKLRSTAGGVIEVGDATAAVYLAAGYTEIVETTEAPAPAKAKPRAKRRGD